MERDGKWLHEIMRRKKKANVGAEVVEIIVVFIKGRIWTLKTKTHCIPPPKKKKTALRIT